MPGYDAWIALVDAGATAEVGDRRARFTTTGALMKGTLAAGTAAWLLVSGCSPTTSSDEFAREDAVDCRELGGGWVFFIRYGREGSSMQGVRFGLPTTDGRLLAEPASPDDEFHEATRMRVAEGWDDDAMSQLSGPDASPKLTARLADSPSCLDQLTSHGAELSRALFPDRE